MNVASFILSLGYVGACQYLYDLMYVVRECVCVCVCVVESPTQLCLYFLSARHATRADGQFTQLMTVLHDHRPDKHTHT